MSGAALLSTGAKSLLGVLLVLVPLSAAQFQKLHLPKLNTIDLTGKPKAIQNGKLGDLGKVAEAVKEVASQSNVQKAAQAIQQSDEMHGAKGLLGKGQGVLSDVAKSQNISDALKTAHNDKIADVVKVAAGTLRKGVAAMDNTNAKDVEDALHHVATQPKTSDLFNMTGSQLMDTIQQAVPKATKALRNAFSDDDVPADGAAGMGSGARVQRVIEKVKVEVANGGGPVSMLTGVLVLAICALCACINIQRQSSARSPALDYGIQLQPSSEEPFFRSF